MYTLFIDESGKNFLRSVESNRPHFCLAGVIIKNSEKNLIKTRADQIKFKYWGRTDIVFHTVEIHNLKGPFSIFQRGTSKLTINDFYKDFISFLGESNFQLSLFCMNRLNYIKNLHLENHISKFHLNDKAAIALIKGTENGIIDKYASNILISFLHFLKEKNSTGQVVIEATGGFQDLLIFKSYNRLLSQGYNSFKLSGEGVRKYFTSIAFVTKNNHDIEMQIADCASSFLNKSERENDGIEKITCPFQQEVVSNLRLKGFKYANSDSSPLLDSINKEC